MGKKDAMLKGLLDIIEHLRGPGGCPWDQKQTKEDLKAYLIDEAYEVLDAIDRGSTEALQEELGDLLFQILFLAMIAREEGEFTIEDVIQSISDKMVRRHPHVFGDKKGKGIEEIRADWKRIKELEGKPSRDSILPELPGATPALYQAQRLTDVASQKAGFDWTKIEDLVQKVEEEWSKLKDVLRYGEGRSRFEEEMGDLLFVMANLGRFINVDSERALRKATDKFIRRFRFIEGSLIKLGKNIREASLEEMDQLWSRAKDKV
jgi:MazG family protein